MTRRPTSALRTAIADAKAVSMPKDNIERAIKKGTGELDGGNVDEVIYEGYGAGGVAVMCDIMTDNRNRTASGDSQDLRRPRRQVGQLQLRRLPVRPQRPVRHRPPGKWMKNG